MLDEANYIKDQYFLEISSPGIERHIRNSLGYNEIDFTIDLLRKVPTVIRKDNFKVTITYIKKKNKKRC